MKNKTVAAVLALTLGSLGIHRFYLGQTGYGILYLLLFMFGIGMSTSISFFGLGVSVIALIDAALFFSMDNAAFDAKYNGREGYKHDNQRRGRQERRYETKQDRQERYEQPRRSNATRSTRKVPKHNPHKDSGIEKYKDYDFEGSIVDFNKALGVNPSDVAVHFNIACAYSITENAEKAFHHLSKAVDLGFSDFEKIQEHDALAYIRIQDEFDAFATNGYQLQSTKQQTAEPAPEISEDLLEQIKRLGELREKGFLTQDEFLAQKRKLLR